MSDKSAQIDRTTEIDVTGMTCNHCVAAVDEALREVPGVKNVSVVLNSGGVSTVTILTDVIVEDALVREAIEEEGYEVQEIRRDF